MWFLSSGDDAETATAVAGHVRPKEFDDLASTATNATFTSASSGGVDGTLLLVAIVIVDVTNDNPATSVACPSLSHS